MKKPVNFVCHDLLMHDIANIVFLTGRDTKNQ